MWTFHSFLNLKKVYFSNSVNVASLACAISALSDDKFIENIKEQNFEAKKLLAKFYLDKEKDIIVNLYKSKEDEITYEEAWESEEWREDLIALLTDEEVETELQQMADLYRIELDQVKKIMGSDNEGLKKDIKVRKAVDFMYDSAVKK